ncbi:MAG: hypothetical protein PHN72_03890 [Bacilli bacterium]|nr:hypothetical protein [Bacilli bacterium]
MNLIRLDTLLLSRLSADFEEHMQVLETLNEDQRLKPIYGSFVVS